METNVLDWLEVTAAACPDKPAFLDEDSAVTFADVRREARIIGTAAAYFIMRALDPKLSKGRWEQKIISVTHPEETDAKK